MIPSIIACATCTPLGPNSRAKLCPTARNANLPEANEAQFAPPLRDAVAPVRRREGGWGELATEARRRGIVIWAKLKIPFLYLPLAIVHLVD
jgi:hypothetical protein